PLGKCGSDDEALGCEDGQGGAYLRRSLSRGDLCSVFRGRPAGPLGKRGREWAALGHRRQPRTLAPPYWTPKPRLCGRVCSALEKGECPLRREGQSPFSKAESTRYVLSGGADKSLRLWDLGDEPSIEKRRRHGYENGWPPEAAGNESWVRLFLGHTD